MGTGFAMGAPLQPSSTWEISSEPYACYLERGFGEGEQSLDLQLRRQVTMGPIRWTMQFSEDDMRTARLETQVEKLPQREIAKYAAVRGPLTNGAKNYLVWDAASADEAFTDDQMLMISAKGNLRWQLQASAMAKAVAALDECVFGLRKELGFNENIAVKPEPVMKPSPATWATNDDYPPQSRRNKDEGIAHFLLMLSETGAVKDCHIVDSSGFAELDAKTCELMRERAKFEPAKDASGAAVTSQYNNRVMWKLPQ